MAGLIAELTLQQGDQRRRAVADETTGHLRVEQSPRDAPGGVREHVEILLRRVEDCQRVRFEQPSEGADVDGQRVDEHEVAGPRQLEQRQLREVRAFTVELGVERVPRLGDEPLDDRSELGVGVDPPVCLRWTDRGAAHESAVSPVSTVRPDNCHASVPPATFTTSTPRSARNSQARRLLAPDRQIT